MTTKLYTKNINVESTHILTKTDLDKDIIPIIQEQRNIIENEIRRNPEFLKYKPIDINHEERILEIMTKAGKIANTGPMAAVAGSISQICLEYLEKYDTKFSIIENGGDIALKTDRKSIISIYAGDNIYSYNLGFKLKAKPNSYGICTSSEDGPSKSFGNTDATIVFCSQSSVADALATSIGNYGNGENSDEIVHNALTYAENYKEFFDGAVVIKGEHLGKIGHIPKLVTIENDNKISDFFEVE